MDFKRGAHALALKAWQASNRLRLFDKAQPVNSPRCKEYSWDLEDVLTKAYALVLHTSVLNLIVLNEVTKI